LEDKIYLNCPYLSKCGGCKKTGKDYRHQLIVKNSQVASLLPKSCIVEPTIGAADPFCYRNKVHSAYARAKSGEILCGPYREGSHKIVNVDSCKIENEIAGAIIRDVATIAAETKTKIYNEKTRAGDLRRCLVRVAQATGEVMVVIVTGSKYFKGKNLFCDKLLEMHPEITTLLFDINERGDSLILSGNTRVIYGRGYITDTLLGMEFRIYPDTFYQVNHAQTETLYTTAIRIAGVTPEDYVLDTYCGIGTTTLAFAKMAGKVVGVELNPKSVKAAKRNAQANKFDNADFICADATAFMQDAAAAKQTCDVLVLDPPRSGTTRAFIKAAGKLSPKKIVYISCNPETLARDVSLFEKTGYSAVRAVPVDMFPWTAGIETVVMLSQEKGEE